METLRRFYHHNAWANRRVFAIARAQHATLLAEAAQGTTGSIEATLKHLVGVEAVYFAMIQGQDLRTLEQRDAFYAHDLDWFRTAVDTLGERYQELLAHIDAGTLERALVVPWLKARLTVHDGLMQVLVHSAQHRAQVFSALGARGYPVPDLDYVEMLVEVEGTIEDNQPG
jgi:uncharacterized damage-inducible protein DinB